MLLQAFKQGGFHIQHGAGGIFVSGFDPVQDVAQMLPGGIALPQVKTGLLVFEARTRLDRESDQARGG